MCHEHVYQLAGTNSFEASMIRHTSGGFSNKVELPFKSDPSKTPKHAAAEFKTMNIKKRDSFNGIQHFSYFDACRNN